jgi:hypothetical protein
MSLLQLSPPPKMNRYRVGAEIRQQDSWGPNAQVGLFIGYNERPGPKGRPACSFLAVKCSNDLTSGQPARTPHPMATFDRLAVVPAPMPGRPALVSVSKYGLGGAAFRPDPADPAPWRWVGVEVTPATIRALWRETPTAPERTLAEIPAAEVPLKDAGLEAHLDRRPGLAGLRFAPWHPQQPIGIYCHNSVIAFRNVVLEPLPDQ